MIWRRSKYPFSSHWLDTTVDLYRNSLTWGEHATRRMWINWITTIKASSNLYLHTHVNTYHFLFHRNPFYKRNGSLDILHSYNKLFLHKFQHLKFDHKEWYIFCRRPHYLHFKSIYLQCKQVNTLELDPVVLLPLFLKMLVFNDLIKKT